jgi:hypothetical protein
MKLKSRPHPKSFSQGEKDFDLAPSPLGKGQRAILGQKGSDRAFQFGLSPLGNDKYFLS